MTKFLSSATYSPEDDKIRLYAAVRLDDADYQRIKTAGFRWAPKQELFFAHWSPSREDLALAASGQSELEPEETTLAERAEAKSERLAELSVKRANESRSLADYANQIGERFAYGQPILMGHHSQRKAQRDAQKIERASLAAHNSFKQAEYWQHQADYVIRHAQHLQASGTRRRRIKTILAEMRKVQRYVNFSARAAKLWNELKAIEDPKVQWPKVITLSGAYEPHHGSYAPRDSYSQLINLSDRGVLQQADVDNVIAGALKMHDPKNDAFRLRWIEHLFHRLIYERQLLGEVPRYEGVISAAQIQRFFREMGADKPKAKIVGDLSTITSEAPLPAVIPLDAGSDPYSITLTDGELRDLMQALGHSIEDATPLRRKTKTVGLLNYKPASGESLFSFGWERKEKAIPVLEMTKAEFARIGKDHKETRVPIGYTENHRVRVAYVIVGKDSKWGGNRYDYRVIYLTDSKDHGEPARIQKEKPTPAFGAYANAQPELF